MFIHIYPQLLNQMMLSQTSKTLFFRETMLWTDEQLKENTQSFMFWNVYWIIVIIIFLICDLARKTQV